MRNLNGRTFGTFFSCRSRHDPCAACSRGQPRAIIDAAGHGARIVPMFETASEKYSWLDNVVAVGVYRPDLGKIAYRVYRIL